MNSYLPCLYWFMGNNKFLGQCVQKIVGPGMRILSIPRGRSIQYLPKRTDVYRLAVTADPLGS